MIVRLEDDERKYVTYRGDDKYSRRINEVSLSKTPTDILERLKSIDKTYRECVGLPFFTFVE